MITTDLDRLEYAQSGTDNTQVFRSSGTDIPVKDASHIKVYVTTTGVFTADISSSTVNLLDTAHGHLDGQELRLSSATSLPTGLLANTIYYVVNKASNTFQVSLSSGGSAVAFTTNGSGTLTWTKTLLKTITTDYTISLSGTTATLTWESGKRPAAADKVLLLREVPFEQNTDLQNNSLFEAESVETQLDLIVNMSQQLKNTTARDLKFSDLLVASDATEASATLTATSAGRANKSLKFDSLGNLGVTTINVDDAQDYTLEAKSWATESPAVVNSYSGTVATPISSTYSAKEHAVGSSVTTGSSKDFATKVDGAVGSTGEFSAKAYAQGGTGVTTASGSAKDWATLATTPSSTATDASAKEWAVGTSTHKSDGSAKDWASQTGADVRAGSSGDKSAKSWAVETGGTAPADGSSKEWAITEGAVVADSEYSAKEYAQGTTATSAKSYATKSDGVVTGTDYSAKAWAMSTDSNAPTDGSAKEWAIKAHNSAVAGGAYSALHHATDALNSATAAKNSAAAVAQVYDNFSDVYLGAMADSGSQGTNPTTNGTWAKNSSSIAVDSASNIKVGQVVTGTGIPTSPKPNVLSIDGTTVVISDNMSALGNDVALTFTGYGVYGNYNTSKDGPALNNDGDALVSGNLFFNSTDNEMRIYDGANWIAATSAGSTSLLEYKFVTTSGQVTSKTYSGTADVGGTLSYTQDNIIVFMNGVQIKNGTDYTANNSTSIVLTTAGVVGDEIAVIAFKSFTTADMVSKSSGGTFASAVTFGGGVEQDSSTQNLTGTYSTERLFLNDSFTLTGDTTVTGHLSLGTVADADSIITNDSSTRTLTGTGKIVTGKLIDDALDSTSLTGMTGKIGSKVTFPTGHCIQIVSHTDSTQRTIASPTGTACEGVQKAITSTVANSNFYISGGISIKQTGSHGGSGIFLNGLAMSANLILSNGHADSSGSGNGWHGWRVSHETSNVYHVCPHHSYLYKPGTHSVGTTFTFYLGAMGYYQNGQVMTNVDGGYSGREGRSNITIMEIAP